MTIYKLLKKNEENAIILRQFARLYFCRLVCPLGIYCKLSRAED